MIIVHRIGLAVVIVGSTGCDRTESIRLAMSEMDRLAQPMIVVSHDDRHQRTLEAFKALQDERMIMPFLPAVAPRRARYVAVLGLDQPWQRALRREQTLIQRHGIPPSASWRAAVRARRCVANGLVT